MRLNRSFLRAVATTLVAVMLIGAFGTSAEAGLFSRMRDTVNRNPVRAALSGVAVAGGAILAAPYLASALGFASGTAVAGAGAAAVGVAGAASGIASIGTAIWGGVVAAGGFVTGAVGAVGAAIGGVLSGVAGFIGGIIASPLFIPALGVIAAAAVGYVLWKRYRRQRQTIGRGSDLPAAVPSVGLPTAEILVRPGVGMPTGASRPAVEIPVHGSREPVAQRPQAPVSVEAPPAATPVNASTALKSAHADYIRAYNRYISLVTDIGGSENPDEELRSNMLRSDVQRALNDYREAYNQYITLLRQSNSK